MSSSFQFINETHDASRKRKYLDDDTRLLEIFETIQDAGFSLRKFLLAAFASDNSKVKAKVQAFYSDGGSAQVVQKWGKDLQRTGNDPPFLYTIIDILVSRVHTELNKLSQDSALRHPASKATHDSIANFSLTYLERTLDEKAPYLARTLRRFAGANPDAADKIPAFVATTGGMLLFLKSRQSNYLQTPMGMYLYAQGCSKSVISVLNHVGLSVSFSSIQNALETLTEDALNNVRDAIKEHSWFLLYDNINFLNRKSDQRSDNKNTFENGATATIVITKGVEKIRQDHNQHPAPCLGDILPDERSNSHLQNVFRFHLVNVLQRHYSTYERCSVSVPSVRPPKPETTEAYPLPAMKIDQSTVDGNVEIIETVMKSVLKLDPNDFSDDMMIIVAGDQLTVSRIESAKRLRREDVTPFHRLQWAVPVIQLFHLQMLLCFTILRTHRGGTSTPGSLALYIEMLERKNLGKDTTNYHAADEMLKHTFDAMIRRVWEVELDTDHLEKYGTDRDDTTLRDDIMRVSEDILQKYLTDSETLRQTCNNETVNAALFIRDTMVYLELCAAIKCGDTGRIVEVLQLINIMFQAGGAKKYAIETMRVMIGIRHGWSPQHTQAILSSWLVNTKGKENSWLPSDLYQEHNNLLTKTVHAAKGSNMSWEFLARSISTNIHLFSRVTAQMESQYSVPFNSTSHTTVKAETDIRLIQQSLKEHNILGHHPFPINPNVLLVKDLLVEGYKKLAEGRFNKFVECMDNMLGSDENDDTLAHESEADIY